MRRVSLAAILAAVGLAIVYLLGAGHSTSRSATTMHSPTAAAQASADALGAPPGGGPQAAAAPHTAVMPTSQASAPASGSSTCARPRYTTSDPTWWDLSPYFVANDMWNVTGYSVSETLYACSYSNWYVVATMDNSKGDGAVKTYPNSHRDFDSNPEISSFSSITSTFAETSPDRGIYEDAYDIWLNGVATPGSTEVMIWNDNHGQVPAGSLQATVTIDGRSYAVWKTTGNYIAFVASTNFTSGTANLLDFFQWLMMKGWIPGNTTLGQVDYGAELVSTNGVPATFTFSDFSVNAS
jgi:glycosyl hydrolase family 12